MTGPTLTLLLLDRFPRRRGAASALQAAVSLLFNAGVAGVLSPLLSASMADLAWGTATLTVLGWAAWLRCERLARKDLLRRQAAGPEAVPVASQSVEPA